MTLKKVSQVGIPLLLKYQNIINNQYDQNNQNIMNEKEFVKGEKVCEGGWFAAEKPKDEMKWGELFKAIIEDYIGLLCRSDAVCDQRVPGKGADVLARDALGAAARRYNRQHFSPVYHAVQPPSTTRLAPVI